MNKLKNIKQKKSLSENSICRIMMIIPSVAIIIFVVIPFIWILYKSFFKETNLSQNIFVGFRNFKTLFHSADAFLRSVANSLLFALGKLVFELPLSLLLAYFLTGAMKGKKAFRIIIFMPYFLSTAVIGVVFGFMFSHQTGSVNMLLNALGLQSVKWFSNRYTALFTVFAASTWQNLGLNMIYFSTGLVNINPSIYEAATIDGCSGTQRFFRITLPLLKSTSVFVILSSVLGSLKSMEIFLITADGAPAGTSESMMTYIYKLFFGTEATYDIGYACAVSIISSLLLMAVGFAYFIFVWRKNSAWRIKNEG